MNIIVSVEEVWEDLKEMGIRSIECDEDFALQNINELYDIFFLQSQLSNLFYIAIKVGVDQLRIKQCGEEGYINESFDKDKIILYAYHNWFMIIERPKKRVTIYKMK